MTEPHLAAAPATPVGSLIQYWRRARGLSQLALAHAADVSARHVSFVETGRAQPSRDMVLLLARVLDVPLRERNALLLSAGFAPAYSETKLDAAALGPVRSAIDAILRQQEPFPAVVLNRRWDVVATNRAADRFFAFLLGTPAASGPANVLRMMFDPNALRPYVDPWEPIAEALVQRAHREALGGPRDPETAALLAEILAYPGVPGRWRTPNLHVPLVPVLPVRFAKDGKAFSYFSAVTTLGTPQDVTVQEIRIETFYPMDPETERLSKWLAATSAA